MPRLVSGIDKVTGTIVVPTVGKFTFEDGNIFLTHMPVRRNLPARRDDKQK